MKVRIKCCLDKHEYYTVFDVGFSHIEEENGQTVILNDEDIEYIVNKCKEKLSGYK